MITCPVCHSKNSVEACLATEAGQAYARLLLNQPDWLRYSLARYILLWAPAKSEMAYDRRLRLATETLALDPDPRRLAVALDETVNALMTKRQAGDAKPLTAHNYLKKVLGSVQVDRVAIAAGGCRSVNQNLPAPRRASKIDQAEQLLAEWAGDDDLRRVIGAGLAALLAMPLAKAPEVAAIDRTASLWERDLQKHGLTWRDAGRLEIAFDRLLSRVKDWFPVADSLFEHLPRKERQEALPEPHPDAGQLARAKEFFAQIGGKGLSNEFVKQDQEERIRTLQEQAHGLKEEG